MCLGYEQSYHYSGGHKIHIGGEREKDTRRLMDREVVENMNRNPGRPRTVELGVLENEFESQGAVVIE